ncbi:hypothetical protein ACHAAC_07985 [Aeromicrobium sp. CF4.19]|uniref:hypothetical protein n=1 Tax=Aeromicrobium sp. CF4.19 TaxID=3373082 RepID=UPI003EE66978
MRSAVVLVLAAVLVAVGLVGWWLAWDVRSSAAAENLAVVDSTATTTVQSEVSQALTTVLTYDFTNPEATEGAADTLLAGDAREEYDTLFASLQERAPDQELVLTAQVQAVAVKTLDADSAELLVFLDQSSQRADDDEASVSAAQLAVEAERVDGSWRITGLEPL